MIFRTGCEPQLWRNPISTASKLIIYNRIVHLTVEDARGVAQKD
jgi:hypothetical protein